MTTESSFYKGFIAGMVIYGLFRFRVLVTGAFLLFMWLLFEIGPRITATPGTRHQPNPSLTLTRHLFLAMFLLYVAWRLWLGYMRWREDNE